MEHIDIGDVRFHVKQPPRVDFPTYRRLQRLLVTQAHNGGRSFLRGFAPTFLMTAVVTWVWINLARQPDYAFLIVDNGAMMVSAPWLWAGAVILFLAGAAAIYALVLSRSRRLLRHLYDQRRDTISEAQFGEHGMRVRWGPTTATAPWSVVDELRVEGDASYLIARHGISLAFTVKAFPTEAEYQAWVSFVRERQQTAATA